MSKMIMSGNEAVARGAYEAGVRFASAYPSGPRMKRWQQKLRSAHLLEA